MDRVMIMTITGSAVTIIAAFVILTVIVFLFGIIFTLAIADIFPEFFDIIRHGPMIEGV